MCGLAIMNSLFKHSFLSLNKLPGEFVSKSYYQECLDVNLSNKFSHLLYEINKYSIAEQESLMSFFIPFLLQPFGCDNQFGSTLKLDNCGVCGGNGSSCSLRKGTKKVQLKQSKIIHTKQLSIDQNAFSLNWYFLQFLFLSPFLYQSVDLNFVSYETHILLRFSSSRFILE